MKVKTLSDKIGYVDKNHVKVGTKNANAVLLVEDVKEAVNKLKKVINNEIRNKISREIFYAEINKIFGEKLT